MRVREVTKELRTRVFQQLYTAQHLRYKFVPSFDFDFEILASTPVYTTVRVTGLLSGGGKGSSDVCVLTPTDEKPHPPEVRFEVGSISFDCIEDALGADPTGENIAVRRVEGRGDGNQD